MSGRGSATATCARRNGANPVTALAANPAVPVWIAASHLTVLSSHCSREGKPVTQMKRSRLAVVDAAARLRAGEPLESVARDAGITPHTLTDRLSRAGFSANGENRSKEQRSELRTYLTSALLRWREPWMDDAACAYVDPELWFPEKGGSARDAKQICATCPVQSQCRSYALDNRERFGVFGGLSERERRKILKGDAA